MSYVENRVLSDELKSVFEEFKVVNEEKSTEIKKFGQEISMTREKMDRMHSRLDEIETKLNRPRIQAPETNQVQSEYTKAWLDWFKKGDNSIANMEVKATFPNLNETIDPQGGYFIPPEYSNFIIESLVQWSPIRRYARVIKVNAKEFRIPVQQQAQNLETGAPAAGLFETGWTADLGPVTQTDTGLIGLKTIPTNDLYALPFATQDMLDDASFDIENYIQTNLAKSIAFAEGKAFISGSGIGQPTGLLTDTTGYSSVTPTTGDQFSIGDSPNVLIEAYYKLPDFYARNATWLMNRQTIRTVREFVDGNGQYLWTPVYGQTIGFEAPARILDRPYAECIDMAVPTGVGAGGDPTYPALSVPILFGDIYSAYVVADRMGIRMLRDPYSNKPFVEFYTTCRVGGLTVLPEAMVKINVKP